MDKKPEKKWCYHYDYLPYKEEDLFSECGYCKMNKTMAQNKKIIKQQRYA